MLKVLDILKDSIRMRVIYQIDESTLPFIVGAVTPEDSEFGHGPGIGNEIH